MGYVSRSHVSRQVLHLKTGNPRPYVVEVCSSVAFFPENEKIKTGFSGGVPHRHMPENDVLTGFVA